MLKKILKTNQKNKEKIGYDDNHFVGSTIEIEKHHHEDDIYSKKPWEKFYNVKENYEQLLQKIPLTEFLEQTVQKYPNNTALNFEGYKISYKKFNEFVNKFATGLINLGLKKGDRVAIHMPNTIQCVISYYATLKAGGVVVMNNPLYTDSELLHQFKDSGVKIIITMDLFADRIQNLKHETFIEHIIYASIGEYLPFPKNFLVKLVGQKKGLIKEVKNSHKMFKFKEFLDSQTIQENNFPKINIDDEAMYQYTSATTGKAKGAVLTHYNMSINAQQVSFWLPNLITGKERNLVALPLFHIFGITVGMNLAIVNSSEMILIAKPKPEALLKNIQKFKPTVAPLVPTMIIGMLNHPDLKKVDMSCIKDCFSGSAPLPVEVMKQFEEKTGALIVEGYGQTESGPVTHCNPLDKKNRKIGSIGIPYLYTDAKVVKLNNEHELAKIGEEGELVVRGPQIMRGYHNLDEKTKETIKDGWLHTGDVVKMDKDGYFYIVDRLKDIINAGGYNIYPREIEEVLYKNPKIKEASVIGIPHLTRGEQPKAFIALQENCKSSQEEIIEYCSKYLAKYKLPTFVEFREELPKNAMGKILKKELRKEELNKKE